MFFLLGMKVFEKIVDLQNALFFDRKRGLSVGLVPTMGALHEGHASLVRRSVRDNDITVVSIFVNPNQFNDKTDLKNYPRTLDKDCLLLGRHYWYLSDLNGRQTRFDEALNYADSSILYLRMTNNEDYLRQALILKADILKGMNQSELEAECLREVMKIADSIQKVKNVKRVDELNYQREVFKLDELTDLNNKGIQSEIDDIIRSEIERRDSILKENLLKELHHVTGSGKLSETFLNRLDNAGFDEEFGLKSSKSFPQWRSILKRTYCLVPSVI